MKWKKIGDILVLDKAKDYGNLEDLAKRQNVKTIVRINHIYGTKREPQIEVLYGSNCETIHKENGCLYKLDVSKVMWSKGNVNERLRIAELVGDDETVIDMFAGIGYFSIPIGVFANPKKVYSMEINPNSYHYLKENVNLNKLDNIEPILGDCKDVISDYRGDRILMGYVKTTHHYLKAAIESLNRNGIIHYHETVPEKLIETRPINRIRQVTDRDFEVLNIQKIKKYSPGVFHISADVRFD